MSTKRKAIELVDKLKHNTRSFNEKNGWQDVLHDAKACALIAVDEIINELNENNDSTYALKRLIYWGLIKQEIEKL